MQWFCRVGYFVFFLTLLWIQVSSGSEFVNVALGKPAMQSTTALGGVAERAVDGNRHPDFFKGSCSHTQNSVKDHWLIMDLLSAYHIQSIIITNRIRAGNGDLREFEIWVSNANPLPISSSAGFSGKRCLIHPEIVPARGPYTFPCENVVTGRYVYLTKPGNTGSLVICEFEVMGTKEGWPTQGAHFRMFPGIRWYVDPFYSTTVQRRSILNCAMTCSLSPDGLSTVVQLELNSGLCECIQVSDFDIDMDDATSSDSGWISAKS